MRKISIRFVKEKMSHNYGLSDFLQHLHCTETEFVAALKNVFPVGHENILEELKKVDEKKSKHKNRAKKNSAKKRTSTQNLISSPVSSSDILEDEFSDAEKSADTILAELKTKEAKIHETILAYKTEYQTLNTTKYHLQEQLQNEEKELQVLKKKIEQQTKIIDDITNELTQINNSISDTDNQLSQVSNYLTEIVAEIKELEKVTIYIYENGEIYLENSNLVLPDTWTEIYQLIISNEFVEDLTIKQIKQLSKLFAFISALNQSETLFEVTFEADLLHSIFEQLQESIPY